MKNLFSKTLFLSLVALSLYSCNEKPSDIDSSIPEDVYKEEFNEQELEEKLRAWTPEEAARHQAFLKSLSNTSTPLAKGTNVSYGSLNGVWSNRAPNNMAGAFQMTELLDGTDTIYGITHDHYSGEFNAKSYVYKGTIYNPSSGTNGDDFELLTGHWPNRYKDFIAFKHNGGTRLVAGIENGPVYYSDDQGANWNESFGLPTVLSSTIMNRQDGLIYTTNGNQVYVSNDGGVTFTLVHSFGGSGDATLYSPRYNTQPNAINVYLAREGLFYTLNGAKTAFVQNGSYSGGHGNNAFSVGGDSRKLYVTVSKDYWVSTNGGVNWTQKYPNGNWYGDRAGDMDAGVKIAVSPENPDYVCGGYAQPVFSVDGLDSDNSSNAGWGSYQNGTSLSIPDYHDRIRFNYHPDFQAHQFFYNSTGDLFYAGSTDGGIFISYKVWHDHPTSTSYDNSSYATAHFINVNTLSTPTSHIYRHNLFTGYKDPTHINYSTQDQGSHCLIEGSVSEQLDVYQSIGGDGPPLKSIDGNWVWKWQREGGQVWAPVELYDGSGNLRQVGAVQGLINSNQSTTFTKNTTVGWIQTYIDRAAPDERMWLLGRDLGRAEVNGGVVSGSTVTKGSNYQISAFTQAVLSPDQVYFLQEGTVYKSTNRGNSYDNGTSTPFTASSNIQNIGGGWVLPTNDNWILFAGPSGNGVGAILSKDGGASWVDVTGTNFPSGDDFQVGGMIGTPDGQYVFAGTDLGPYVFDVAAEEWSPMYAGTDVIFNTTDIEYIESIKTVRFGTWGSGVWDFTIDDGSPSLSLNTLNNSYELCDSIYVNWSTNMTGALDVALMKGGVEVDFWVVDDASEESFIIPLESTYEQGSDYSIEISAGGLTRFSSVFSVNAALRAFDNTRLIVDFVDSQEGATRDADFTVDGDLNTFWHSAWSASQPDFPHEIIYHADTIAEWVAFSYLPRQDGSSNGRIAAFEIYGSNDNKSTWALLSSGTLANQAGEQTITFDNTLACDFIRFNMISEHTGAFYGSMSEFSLFTRGICDGEITSLSDESVNATTVYPTLLNSNQELRIKGISTVNEPIVISRFDGVTVDKFSSSTNEISYSLKGYGPGVYFIRIGQRETHKFIVQ